MRVVLSAMGRSFIRNGLVAFLALASGIWVAPNYDQAKALAGAASIAALIAAFRGLLVFVPQLSKAISGSIGAPVAFGEIVLAGVTAIVGGFLSIVIDVLSAPNINAGKAIALAGMLGVGSVITRLIQAFLTPGESPAPGAGIPVPSQPVDPASLPVPEPPFGG